MFASHKLTKEEPGSSLEALNPACNCPLSGWPQLIPQIFDVQLLVVVIKIPVGVGF